MVPRTQINATFFEFAEICKKIEEISSLTEMKNIISEFLKTLEGENLEVATRFMMGKVFPGDQELGIGPGLLYSALSSSSGESLIRIKNLIKETGDTGLAAKEALSKGAVKKQTTFSSFAEEKKVLTLAEVYKHLDEISKISGSGAQGKKTRTLQYLFNVATPEEAVYLARLVIEELRIGAGEGVVRDAIAQAFEVSSEEVERAYMLTNDLGLVAKVAKAGKLNQLGLELFRPVRMMLAQIAESIPEAVEEIGEVAVEWKYDGARVQIHKMDKKVVIYSRRLENVTGSLPDIQALIKYVGCKEAILDGEVIAVGSDGKPRAFQDILKRFRRKYDVQETAKEIPLSLVLFDILFKDGKGLIDLPLRERRRILESCVSTEAPGAISTGVQILTSEVEEVQRIYGSAIAAGHEGVMLKNPLSAYTPGKRGKNWLKLKPEAETLDLVVIGAEWGEGKRAHLLGSYVLACRDENTGELPAIGKVGTGMTDEMLSNLTGIFEELIIPKAGKEVDIKPVKVFEIGYEEIQKSPNYSSGYALRFPRLVNLRDDKTVEDVDTIDKIEQVYNGQKSGRVSKKSL